MKNNYNSGFKYREGDKISGYYHGVSYSGVVAIARRHSIRLDQTEIHVLLDKPITVYKHERERIIVSILDSGEEV